MAKGEGRVKACTECRQQKLRCDAHEDYSKPCSRCRKLHLDCQIQSAFKRVKKQTKAELQREIDRLRTQSQQSQLPLPLPLPAMNSSPPSLCLDADTWTAGGFQTPIPANIPSHASSHSRNSNASLPSFRTSSNSMAMLPGAPPALSRTLEGQEIDSKKIDDCFKLFFEHYSASLPIIDPTLSPDQCYSQSPFLFWAIVCIGSRRYPDDPTLLGWLAPRINSIALSSLSSRTTPIQKIQGLLLLCTWPIPINTMSKDITNILSGAALHLALQIGLHVLGVGQDFERNKVDADETEKIFRARLWLQCLKTCQSTSFCEGLPPPTVMDTEDFERNSNEMILILQPDLRYRQRVHNVQTAAVVSMMKKGIFSATQATVINSLVKIFDAQLTELVSECPSTTESLYLNCARVQIQAFYFFAKSDSLDIVGLTELYSIAQALVNDATVLGELDQLAAVCSTYICRSISLAAFSILKISKSSLSSFLDFRTGERAYFAAIRFLKKASLENDDLSAKAAAILTQLWTSDRVFKRADGEIESLTLRIRSRSSMSVVFDCIWWWREEFGGQTSPFSDMTAPAKEDVAFNEPIEGVHRPEYTLGMIDDAPLTEFPPVEYLPDYDWVASLTFPPGNMALPNVDI